MALDLVDIKGVPFTAWDEPLAVVAECIKFGIDTNTFSPRVYDNWIYEIDPSTMLGKITADMKAVGGSEDGLVHCWTLGISDAKFDTTADGEIPYVGGHDAIADWDIAIDFWGFWSNDNTAARQKRAIDEARTVGMTLLRNRQKMLEFLPALRKLSPPRYTSLQPMPMSGGESVTVAMGVMRAQIAESLGI